VLLGRAFAEHDTGQRCLYGVDLNSHRISEVLGLNERKKSTSMGALLNLEGVCTLSATDNHE
jgi:hypothetical protein